MKNETRVTVSTKADAKSDAVKTALVLNWDGMTTEDIRELAQQALVVKLQGGWRRNGIPTETTVNVVEHKAGTRAPKKPADVLALIQNMSPEDRAAAIAALSAGVDA